MTQKEIQAFCFSTCDRRRALGFLRKLYPNCIIEDSGPTKDLLDLVEQDVCRIDDPDCHSPAQVRLKDNSREAEVVATAQRFHEHALLSRKGGAE